VPNTKDQVPTILIADDNEANRFLLTEVLEAEHYRIVHAEDGDEALQLVEEGEVDLVRRTL
jgi:CheY-like chemotaxis protein